MNEFEGSAKKHQDGFVQQSEEKSEEILACNSWDLSECLGVSTVEDYPTIDVVYADNSAYNKTQTRGV